MPGYPPSGNIREGWNENDPVAFALHSLGPASADLVKGGGLNPQSTAQDAALSSVFSAIAEGKDPQGELREEFFSFLYEDCKSMAGLTSQYPPVKAVADTHDLMSEVILGVLEASAGLEFPGLASFRSLIWTRMAWKAHRIATKQQRNQDRIRTRRMDEEHFDDPAEELSQKELFQALADSFANLSAEDRQVLSHYASGRKSTETGEVLGLTPVAVRKRTQRALERLQGAILRNEG